MRSFLFVLVASSCALLAGCGDSSAPVAGGGPGAPGAPAGPPGMPGDGGMPAESSPPSDGAQGSDYTPPPESTPDSGMPGDYTPPDDGLAGTYDGGNPDYNPDGSMGPPGPPRVKSMHERAIDAFRAGKDVEAFALLRTHLAVSAAAGSDVATKMAWIPGLKRPGIGARIGIAAQYMTPVGDFADSPQPIGSAQLKQALAAVAQNSGRQRGNAGESVDPAAGIDYGSDPNQSADPTKAAVGQLEFYAGDFGTKLLDALKAKIESGEYGLLYKDLVEELARPAAVFDPNNPNAGYDPNYGANSGEPSLSGATPGDGYVDPNSGVAAGQPAAGPSRLAMGVLWLGKFDKREEMAKQAQDAGVDVLVTYEIALSATRVGNLINNRTRIKITDAKKGDALFTSPVLENRVVMQGREKGQSEEDPVDKQVARAIEKLDEVCKPAELPAGVNAERVKARVAGLIAEKPADPLPVLLEMRFYTAKGLLTPGEMQAAAVSLLGEAEYAQLIASSPSGGISDAIGGAISLPGMIGLLRGVNTATGASARAEARKRQAAANGGGEAGQPKARGWFDLLPRGGKKQ